MKKLLLLSTAILFIATSQAQVFKNVLKNVTKKDSTGKTGIAKVFQNTTSKGLSTEEISNGLKEALTVGTKNASNSFLQ